MPSGSVLAPEPVTCQRSRVVRATLVVLVIAGCGRGREDRLVVATRTSASGVETRSAPPAPPSSAPVVQLSAAGAHACARHADGAVSCWGDNANGQLGVDAFDARRHRDRPVAAPVEGALELSTSAGRTCVRRTDGAWCWGGPATTPEHIAGTGDAVELAGRCVRNAAGVVRCWRELLAADEAPYLRGALALSSYDDRVCAVEPLGEVRCAVPNRETSQLEPESARVIEGAVEVAAGGELTCVRVADGGVACWNDARYAYSDPDSLMPRRIAGIDHAVQIVASAGFACEREQTGEVRCWGNSPPPGMPDATYADAIAIPGIRADELAAGDEFACARRGDAVWCWGANELGQVGNGWSTVHPAPIDVPGIDDAIDVHVGEAYACVRRRGGGVTCWGRLERYGAFSPEPLDVPSLFEAVQLTGQGELCGRFDRGEVRCGREPGRYHTRFEHVTDVAAADPFSAAVRSDGSLAVRGELDLGAPPGTAGTRAGDPVAGVRDAVAVAAGPAHLCYLRRGGTAGCIGMQSETLTFGDLSREHDRIVSAFAADKDRVEVAHALQLAVGARTACAVIEGGTVQCWGSGVPALLGDRDRAASRLPTAIAGLDGVVQLAGSDNAMCARRNDGTVWCFGSNADGLLGEQLSMRSSAEPVAIPLRDVVDLDVGHHACAVRANGTVACWGASTYGQVGTISSGYIRDPTRVDFARGP